MHTLTKEIKRRDPEARYAALLKAAQELIFSNGVAAMTIDDIVRQAGVAKGTFYLHFKSKEDVINAVVEAIFERLVQGFITKAESRDIPITERLLWLAKALTELAHQPGARELSLTVHQAGNLAIHRRMEEKAAKFLIPILEKIIAEGIASGVFHIDNPYLSARWVAGAFLGLDYAFGDAAEIDAAITHLSGFILRGLGYRGEADE
jgi:AcrR family transcriptional regulator